MEESTASVTMKVQAYLEITMVINPENRPAAARVYTDYRQPFLGTIEGALTKELLIRDEDAQVIHGFDSMEHAQRHTSKPICSKTMFSSGSSRLGPLTLMCASTKLHNHTFWPLQSSVAYVTGNGTLQGPNYCRKRP